MKKYIILFLFASIASTTTNAQFGDILDKAKSILNKDEGGIDVSGGLKEALKVGVDEAVQSLTQENGYFESPYKILIPDDAQKVLSTVSKVPGFKTIQGDLTKKMNEAAEIAAKKAGPIFLNAIKQMTFSDATNILMGKPDAATRYLERTSQQALYKEFMPIIQSALDEVHARSLWKSASDAYNKIPFQKKMNPDLDDHVNKKALAGLFSLIEKKEEGIRSDIGMRNTPLLQDVFAKQDKD